MSRAREQLANFDRHQAGRRCRRHPPPSQNRLRAHARFTAPAHVAAVTAAFVAAAAALATLVVVVAHINESIRRRLRSLMTKSTAIGAASSSMRSNVRSHDARWLLLRMPTHLGVSTITRLVARCFALLRTYALACLC